MPPNSSLRTSHTQPSNQRRRSERGSLVLLARSPLAPKGPSKHPPHPAQQQQDAWGHGFACAWAQSSLLLFLSINTSMHIFGLGIGSNHNGVAHVPTTQCGVCECSIHRRVPSGIGDRWEIRWSDRRHTDGKIAAASEAWPLESLAPGPRHVAIGPQGHPGAGRTQLRCPLPPSPSLPWPCATFPVGTLQPPLFWETFHVEHAGMGGTPRGRSSGTTVPLSPRRNNVPQLLGEACSPVAATLLTPNPMGCPPTPTPSL